MASLESGGINSYQKISGTLGGLTASLPSSYDNFGWASRGVELNGDSITDLLVGAIYSDDGGGDKGAVYLIFLEDTGLVSSSQKISQTSGYLTANLHTEFGSACDDMGDVNADTMIDLAVGCRDDDTGAVDTGAFFLLFLDTNYMVLSHLKFASLTSGFTASLTSYDLFGSSLANMRGDLNNDGIIDFVVGAPGDDDGGDYQGAVYVFFMNNVFGDIFLSFIFS